MAIDPRPAGELGVLSERATELLSGKVLRSVDILRSNEVLLVFADGRRLFLTAEKGAIEISITDGMVRDAQ